MRVEGRTGAVPEPGQHGGGSFAEAGRDIDKQRATFAASRQRFGIVQVRVVAARKAALVIIRRVVGRGLEILVESKSAHDSPPVLSADAKYLVMGCMCFLASRQGKPALHSPQRGSVFLSNRVDGREDEKIVFRATIGQ